MDNQTIYEFKKNLHEKVRIGFSNFKGSDVLSIWVYFNANPGETDEEKWIPSKKGISMRTDLMPELKKGIEKAHKEYQKLNQTE